jgi:hypothetical protein
MILHDNKKAFPISLNIIIATKSTIIEMEVKQTIKISRVS